MKSLKKAGGLAAVYAGVAYIVGIVGFLFIVGWPDDPVEQMSILVNRQVSLHILYLIVYQVWAVSLIILNLSLYEQMKSESPTTMAVSASTGIIWATLVVASGMIFNIGMDNVVGLYAQNPMQATTAWVVIASVCDGIGGGNELLGGLWILLICVAALRAGKFPRILNYIGLGAGVSGILSALPRLGEAGLFFGLLQIVWFLWLGIILLRGKQN